MDVHSDADSVPDILHSPRTGNMSQLTEELSDVEAYGMHCTVDESMSGEARVTLSMPFPEGLTRSTAEAWGFDRDKPLFMSVWVGQGLFRRDPAERVEATFFQERAKDGYKKLHAGMQLTNIAKTFWRHLCGATVPPPPSDAPERLVAKKRASIEEAKRFGGFLLPLTRYMMRRIPCLHEYCVICDEPLVFPPLLRPTVCSRTLCSYSLRAYGAAIAGEFSGQNASSEIWDLLVAMAICAGNMPDQRLRVLFGGHHFPSLFLPGKSLPELVPDQNGFVMLRQLLQDLSDFRDKHVEKLGVFWINEVFRSEGNPLLGAMAGWIWDSNRSYMLSLSEADRIPALGTQFQYLLLSAPPEMEAAFQENKRRYGTEFCFHGSGPGNWHCILRQGLKNASGTILMTSGQAHGPGIYLATDSDTSAAYSRVELCPPMRRPQGQRPQPQKQPQGKKNKNKGQGVGANAAGGASPVGEREPPRNAADFRVHDPAKLVMLAICEVALVPTLRKNGTIWVCPDETAVVTRYLLVYSDTVVPTLNTQNPALGQQLHELTHRRMQV